MSNLMDDYGKELLKTGLTFWDTKNYDLSFPYFLKTAVQYDHPFSQHRLGYMYMKGYGTTPDHKEALYWFKKALGNGEETAKFYIGQIYYDGESGVQRDYKEAMKWFLKATDVTLYDQKLKDCCSKAQKGIATIYLLGLDTPIDSNLALQWFAEAAANGSKKAMYEVGLSHLAGSSTLMQYKMACKWLTNAAERGLLVAQLRLGIFYQEQHFLRDYKKSMDWLLLAADINTHKHGKHFKKCFEAQYYIGLIHLNGLGVPVAHDLASWWFEKSVENGCQSGKLELSLMYYKGQCVPKQEKQCIEWLTSLAYENHVPSQVALGCLLSLQGSVLCDYDKAIYWLQKAICLKDSKAQFQMGCMYEAGLGVQKNDKFAFHCFEQAAKQGFSDSQFALGRMYAQACGTSQDWNQAIFWYKKCIENNGNQYAQYNLAQCYLHGYGGFKDQDEGLKLLKQSAEQGNSEARNGLAMLQSRQNVDEDLTKSQNNMHHNSKEIENNFEYCDMSTKKKNRQYVVIQQKLHRSIDSDLLISLKNIGAKNKNSVDKSWETKLERDSTTQRGKEEPIYFHVENNRNTMINTKQETFQYIHLEGTHITNMFGNTKECVS